MESKMQLQSKQLDRQSTGPEKDSCTSIDDDFVAECSSADNSIHTSAPSETSRSFAQRRSRPRSGKLPLEEAMIETERKKLDLMQSMGNGREDWDTFKRRYFKRPKNKKRPKVAPVHLKCSSFITRMEDRIKEKEANT